MTIRAIVTDIDGVILGNKVGSNFPLPSILSQRSFKEMKKNGISVSLCSAKAYFAIEQSIVLPLGLTGTHLTDAGALLVNAKTGERSVTGFIPKAIATSILTTLHKAQIYFEYYTTTEYFIFPSSDDSQAILEGRINNLSVPPTTSATIQSVHEIIKIYVLPKNDEEWKIINTLGKEHREIITLHTGKNPSLVPDIAAFFTHKDATKEAGMKKLSEITGVPLSETLGIGDSTNDWSFMKECGAVATLSNGTEELKRLVNAHPNGYVSTQSITSDGFSDIVRNFKLI